MVDSRIESNNQFFLLLSEQKLPVGWHLHFGLLEAALSYGGEATRGAVFLLDLDGD